jgi:hypothetical protein
MAFLTIPSSATDVGAPITKDLMDKLRTNGEDHEVRISAMEANSSVVYIVNGDMSFAGFDISNPNIFYYKAKTSIIITDFRVQLFSKDGISSGFLSFDLQKSINTNDVNFSTILSSNLSINFASASDYSEFTATLDGLKTTIAIGSVLRIKVTELPTGFRGQVLISVGAQ